MKLSQKILFVILSLVEISNRLLKGTFREPQCDKLWWYYPFETVLKSILKSKIVNHQSSITLLALTLLFTPSAYSQEETSLLDNISLNGYMKYMNTVLLPPRDSGRMITDNLIHNRLNYTWYLNENFTFKTSMRNRIFYGELTRLLGTTYSQIGEDPGFLDLSILWVDDESFVLHTIFDRMNLTYQKDDWEVIVGRQRINWGMNLVWNPNDIFNSYSFFDFDYEERPGTDAVQVNYFTGPTSSVSVVYELADSLKGSSFAAKYKWNTNNYDLQLFGGYQKEYFVAGLGWAGDIKGAGFRGEGTYFIPQDVGDYQFVGSIDADYTLTNGMFLHISYLFNSIGINASEGDYAAYYFDRNLSVQTLSPAMHNIFAETSGAFTPILTGSIAGMVNPSDGSWFIGPGVTWSVAENFDLLTFAQLFRGDPRTLYGDGGSILFLRFKYSF